MAGGNTSATARALPKSSMIWLLGEQDNLIKRDDHAEIIDTFRSLFADYCEKTEDHFSSLNGRQTHAGDRIPLALSITQIASARHWLIN